MTEAITPSRCFFIPDGNQLVPQPIARGPWGMTMHGRLFGGLAAREIERLREDDPELACTRLTVELFRSAPIEPVSVSHRVIRSGRRIMVVEATVMQRGEAVGQGKAVLLRRSQQPPGTHPVTPHWDVPTPHEMGEPSARLGTRRFEAPWDSWNVTSRADTMQGLRGGLWMRENQPLVEGEPLTPLIRIAMAADLVSPVGNSSTEGLGFINADYTIYLGHEPRGEFIGIQPYGHLSEDGIAVAQCVAHDLEGPIGFLATTAVANSMSRSNEGMPPRR